MRKSNAARTYWPSSYNTPDLSPRQKLALRLYHTGVVPTKAEAAKQAGLARGTFYIASTRNPNMSAFAAQIDKELADETIDTARLIKQLGRKALSVIAKTMENPLVKPEVQLKAAQDLADRSPETSKVINVNAHVTSPLSDEHVLAMRNAILEAAGMKEKYAQAASGTFVTVDDKSTARSLDLVKERAPLALPGGNVSD